MTQKVFIIWTILTCVSSVVDVIFAFHFYIIPNLYDLICEIYVRINACSKKLFSKEKIENRNEDSYSQILFSTSKNLLILCCLFHFGI